MACACNKRKRKQTAYATPAPPPPDPEGPVQVQFNDGSIEEFATRLDAHAARIIRGGGVIIRK